jgi:hypothetical protein
MNYIVKIVLWPLVLVMNVVDVITVETFLVYKAR